MLPQALFRPHMGHCITVAKAGLEAAVVNWAVTPPLFKMHFREEKNPRHTNCQPRNEAEGSRHLPRDGNAKKASGPHFGM